jgi:hypothetical protein
MSDGFIQKNIERLKLQIFLNKITTVQQDVETIKALMNELLSSLPAELHPKKAADPKFIKSSALFLELKNIGEKRKRKELSKKLDKIVIEDDDAPIEPSAIREIRLGVVKEEVGEDSNDEYPKSFKEKVANFDSIDDDEEGIKKLMTLGAVRVDSFDDSPNDQRLGSKLSGDLADRKTLADYVLETPKLKNIVSNRFLRKTTFVNPGHIESSEADASIATQIMIKLDCVNAKLNTLKSNLSENEGAIKNQIGSRMAIDVKKNMGVTPSESQPKNKLLFILHDNWAVMASMMMGIQKSTNSLLSQNFALKDKDFQLQYTFELRPAQVSSKDNELDMYSKSIFYDYAPYVFRDIRQTFNISSKNVASRYAVPQLAGSRRRAEQSAPGRADLIQRTDQRRQVREFLLLLGGRQVHPEDDQEGGVHSAAGDPAAVLRSPEAVPQDAALSVLRPAQDRLQEAAGIGSLR